MKGNMETETGKEPSPVVSQNQQLAQIDTATMSNIILTGDLSALTPEQKVQYIVTLCKRVGLDPATQPFKLLKLQGKVIPYADRSCAAQLNRLHGVSHSIVGRENVEGCYIVTARASASGRQTESIGAVPIKGLSGDALCNAMMKAETKAKRRATLDLLGLGMVDETEVGSIAGAVTVDVSAPAVKMPPPEQPNVQPAAPLEYITRGTPVDILISKVGGKDKYGLKLSANGGEEVFGTFDKSLADEFEEIILHNADIANAGNQIIAIVHWVKDGPRKAAVKVERDNLP